MPWIKFRGLWLRRAGFEVNENVKVRVMKGAGDYCGITDYRDFSRGIKKRPTFR
ncbi:SymE family type I addiction module toxin [Pseudomonas sp. RIT-PI-r]|uniref:SymE family type I addiction module toxin n=1 Tax=Pseudomonas sp. RIT-PI-r TaxID=1699620 RepID=UPI003FA7B6AD